MAGASMLQVDARELDRVALALAGASLKIKGDVLEAVGSEVESQVRRRIDEEKSDADGAKWPEWSERYRPTRQGQHSLLINEGELLDSIQHAISGASVDVGSNLIYAATHQYGDPDRNIPPRPFLGLSDENERSLMDLIEDVVAGRIEL